MSAYVKSGLSPGENIVYATRRHWYMLVLHMLSMVALIGLIGYFYYLWKSPWILTLLLVPAAVIAYRIVEYVTSVYVVTDKRVIIKTGWLSVKTYEINRSKIESILVEQNFPERLLGSGKVSLIGSGGTLEALSAVANPALFRKHLGDFSAGGEEPEFLPDGSSPTAAEQIKMLQDLSRLRSEGALTDEEFERQKRKIIG